jgi:hypothetical protein
MKPLIIKYIMEHTDEDAYLPSEEIQEVYCSEEAVDGIEDGIIFFKKIYIII